MKSLKLVKKVNKIKMEIVDKIDKSLTDALKNKDQDRTLTLRSIISQKKQKEIEKRTQDKKNITDEDMILILNKMVKQRKSRLNYINKVEDKIW